MEQYVSQKAGRGKPAANSTPAAAATTRSPPICVSGSVMPSCHSSPESACSRTLFWITRKRMPMRSCRGWTHQRPAMVTSWGSVVAGYASALERDMQRLLAVISRVKPQPARRGPPATAHPGRSTGTTPPKLMAFPRVLEQSRRRHRQPLGAGRRRRGRHHALHAPPGHAGARIGFTLSAPAYGFIGLPKNLTTGSSIMPQKAQSRPLLESHPGPSAPSAIGLTTSLLSAGRERNVGISKRLAVVEVPDYGF